MLEYLRFAGYQRTIDINKYRLSAQVIPSKLCGLEHTIMKKLVIPQ